MDKRYQVFVSSTFEDLKEERQAVLKGILEVDQMPAGMELFPASDEDAWQLITDVIDQSDYYVVIIGGRYGSLDHEGLGYTEREYDYAWEVGKPIIPLLHKDPDQLPREQTDTGEAAWERLQSFRGKVEENHTCAYWDGPEDLKAKVIVGLTAAMKRSPGVGWVRADEIPEYASPEEILALNERIAELEAEREADRTSPPEGAERLAQGDDTFAISVVLSLLPPDGTQWKPDKYSITIRPSWNDIFAAIAPTLINEAQEKHVRKALEEGLKDFVAAAVKRWKDRPDGNIVDVTYDDDDIATCFVQLRALGLIRESVRKRSVKDTATYWTLTPYGDHMLVTLRAIPRDQDEVT